MFLLLSYTSYWQVKEYRWDRLWADFQPPWQVLRRYRRPRPTGRTLAVLFLGSIFGFLISVIFYFVFWGQSFSLAGLVISYIFFESLTPFGASLGVIITTPLVSWDYRRQYQKAAQKRQQLPKLRVVAITGSYGKTSVKEIVAGLLEGHCKLLKTPENINSAIGVSQIILSKLDSGIDLFIAELAAYKRGDIQQATRIVQPEIGILTGLAPQHLALFGSFHNIKQAKFELIKALPKDGVAVFNFDDSQVRQLAKQTPDRVKVVGYGLNNQAAAVRAEAVQLTKTGSCFQLNYGGSTSIICLGLLGRANVLNFLAGAAVALELGVSLAQIARAAKNLKAPPSTLQLSIINNQLSIIDDSYNANPAGIRAALEVLGPYQNYTKIVIMPSLIELGRRAGEIHKKLAQEISKQADYLFVTDKKFEKQVRAGWQGRSDQLRIGLSCQTILTEIQSIAKKRKTVILLEGRIPGALRSQILNPKS